MTTTSSHAGRTPKTIYGDVVLALLALCEFCESAPPTEFERYWLARFPPEEIRGLIVHLA